MARYIDADRMQDFLVETNDIDDWCVSQYNADWISSFIESQPTADVVEVVRCCECKYSRPRNKSEKNIYFEGVLICEKCCKGKYKTTGGYHWEYADNLLKEMGCDSNV